MILIWNATHMTIFINHKKSEGQPFGANLLRRSSEEEMWNEL